MSVAVAQELKGLQTQRDTIKGELYALRGQVTALQEQIKSRQDKLNGVMQQIEKIEEQSAEYVITEHALLRFLERVDLIDMEQLKERILPGGVRVLADFGGSGTYPAGTHRVVIKKKSVVTVLEAE